MDLSKKALKQNISNHWFAKLLIHLFFSIGSFFLMFIKSKILFFISLFIPFIALSLIISKSYKKGLPVFITLILIELILLFFKIYIIRPFDFYSTNIESPQNIIYKLPKSGDLDSLKTRFKNEHINSNHTDFEVYSNNTEGIYYYTVWYKPKTKGYLYLKAIEITKNDTLSPNSLKMSSVNIDSLSNSFQTLQPRRSFCIKEGDNGDYYIARFELWFKDSNKTKDTLLLTKNYKISGFEK